MDHVLAVDQQRAISDTSTRFGAEQLAPFALQWEQDRHFPAQVLREAGRLKMGGLHVAAWMIDTYGDRDQRHRWLPGLCALTDLAVYCMAEAGTGSDVAGSELRRPATATTT